MASSTSLARIIPRSGVSRQAFQPDDAIEQVRNAFPQPFPLAHAQIGAELDDGIAGGQCAEPLELLQQTAGERTGTRAEFEDLSPSMDARTGRHWRARQKANSGEISGAVTKSPPRPA